MTALDPYFWNPTRYRLTVQHLIRTGRLDEARELAEKYRTPPGERKAGEAA